jgi:hypothetical protein
MSFICSNVGNLCPEKKPGKMVQEVCPFCNYWSPKYPCKINDEIYYRRVDAKQKTFGYIPELKREEIFKTPELRCYFCREIVDDGVLKGKYNNRGEIIGIEEFICFNCAKELGMNVEENIII